MSRGIDRSGEAPRRAGRVRAPALCQRYAVFEGLLLSVLLLCVASCGVEPLGEPPPHDALYYPMSVAAHPEGRYLYVTNTSFDRKYRASTVTVVDSWTRQLIPEATVELGLFAGELAIQRRRCLRARSGERCDDPLIAYTSSRDEGSLVQLTIDDQAGPAQHLSCDSLDADRRCAGASVRLEANGQPLAQSPFSIALDQRGLFLTHLDAAVLSRWVFDEETRERFPRFQCQTRLLGGSKMVLPHPRLPLAYVSSSQLPVISVLRSAERGLGSCRVENLRQISVGSTQLIGESRGLSFSLSGDRLYVASAGEKALRIYDTRAGEDGLARDVLLATVPLGAAPNMVRVAGLGPSESVAQAPRGVAEAILHQRGGGLVYVSLFEERALAVIDPDRLQMIAKVELTGPAHDIAFLPDASGRLKAFVSIFEGNSLNEIDIEAGSETRFQRLAVIR